MWSSQDVKGLVRTAVRLCIIVGLAVDLVDLVMQRCLLQGTYLP